MFTILFKLPMNEIFMCCDFSGNCIVRIRTYSGKVQKIEVTLPARGNSRRSVKMLTKIPCLFIACFGIYADVKTGFAKIVWFMNIYPCVSIR